MVHTLVHDKLNFIMESNNLYPQISIITISYNSEKTIEETIRSVVSQNYPNLEYIIIDGASKDKTLDIVNKYKDHIAIISSEPDNGISDAFNKGIAKATGEIIGIINSDDILMPDALQTIADVYDPTIDVYSGNVLFWDDNNNNTCISKPDIDFSKLKLQYGVAHPSRFIRKDAYEKWGGYDLRFRYNMDTNLLCRFYQKGAKFIHIDKELTKFRMGATTADPVYKKKEDYRLFVECYGGSQRDFKKLWAHAIFKYKMIQLAQFLFGNDFRYTIKNNWFCKTFLGPIAKIIS